MKFCPRCGTPIKGNEKFCTKCGFPLKGQAANSNNTGSSVSNGSAETREQASAQPQPNVNNYQQGPVNYQQNWQQANQTLNKAENYSSNYFNWLLNTIKHPANFNSHVHPYFGLTSFVAAIILSFGTFFMMIRGSMGPIKKVAKDLDQAVDDSGNYASGNEGVAEKIFASINYYCRDIFDDLRAMSSVKAIVLLVLFTLAFILVGFLVRKYLVDGNDNLFHYTNQLASLTNYALIFEVVALLVAIVEKSSYHTGNVIFILALFALSGLAYLIGFIRSIYSDKRGGFDPCYLIVLSVIILMAVNYVIIKVIL